MKNRYLLIFLLGLSFPLLLGAFTRDWDESVPTDSTVANQIDEYNRYLRVDTSDRLENMFYGFIAGENTLSQHCQYLQFYEQASIATPSAGYGRLGTLAVGGKCELHWKDEDGDLIELTEGGKWMIGYGTASQALMWNTTEEDGDGGRESQIRATGEQSGGERTTLGYDEFSHEGTGDDEKGQLRFFLNDGDDGDAPTLVMTIPSTGVAPTMVESTAPTTDAQLANKKYVDDSQKPYARMYLNAAQNNLVNATATKVALDTDSYDSGTITDLTNNRITPGIDGYYLCIGQAVISNPGNDKQHSVMLYKNGALTTVITHHSTGVGEYATGVVVNVIYLDNNDYLELWVKSDKGTDTADLVTGTSRTFLSLFRIGT